MFYFESFKLKCCLFYILSQHKTFKTDITLQEILMCPSYTFHLLKKILHEQSYTTSSSVAPSRLHMIHSKPTRAQEVDAIHRAVCVHSFVPLTCPTSAAALQDTCTTELTHGSSASFQSCLRFLVFQGWIHLVVHKEQFWGAEVYTSFLRPVGVLAGLYYCSTAVVKDYFPLYYNVRLKVTFSVVCFFFFLIKQGFSLKSVL